MNAIASVISIEDALEWMYKNKKRLLPTKLVINRHAAQRHRLGVNLSSAHFFSLLFLPALTDPLYFIRIFHTRGSISFTCWEFPEDCLCASHADHVPDLSNE